jgi:hypothetical protein
MPSSHREVIEAERIVYTSRAGNRISMRHPFHPRKGTIMIGGMTGYYEPEWDEQADRALKAEATIAQLKNRPTEDAYLRACRALHWRTAQLRANGIEPLLIKEDAAQCPSKDDITPKLLEDVTELVIAARKAWEEYGDSGDALDRALERFSSRVSYCRTSRMGCRNE